MSGRKVLLTTLPPTTGGVPAKAEIMARHLRRLGHKVTVAHYATLTGDDALSPTLFAAAGGRRPGVARRFCFGDFPCIAVGCLAPEFEFTYYLPSRRWDEIVAGHDRHIAVGGTVLASYPLLAAGVPHLIWYASTMIEDRMDRRRAMAWPRRLFDASVVGPVQARMERKVLAGPGGLMPVSRHARDSLVAAGARPERISLVPIPVNADFFSPSGIRGKPGTIGFAGRLGDPRKNPVLLFDAMAAAIRMGADLRLKLTGEEERDLAPLVVERGLEGRIEWTGWVDRERLPDFYRSLDLFVIPSLQEGFGIVGIEAMSCGVPVVSTDCGGPADYVRDGKTGYLVPFDAEAMAERIVEIVRDRALHGRMSAAARELAVSEYSHIRFEAELARRWRETWNEEP